MQALEGEKTDNPLVVDILGKLSALCERADIVFCWLPSYIGIAGNGEADKAAKDAYYLKFYLLKSLLVILYRLLIVLFMMYGKEPSNEENKLFAIKPNISEWLPGSRSNRREEIILARSRIGHTHMTGEELPECIPCNTTLSVKHLMIECTDLAPYRDKYFHADSLKTLFDTVE